MTTSDALYVGFDKNSDDNGWSVYTYKVAHGNMKVGSTEVCAFPEESMARFFTEFLRHVARGDDVSCIDIESEVRAYKSQLWIEGRLNLAEESSREDEEPSLRDEEPTP